MVARPSSGPGGGNEDRTGDDGADGADPEPSDGNECRDDARSEDDETDIEAEVETKANTDTESGAGRDSDSPTATATAPPGFRRPPRSGPTDDDYNRLALEILVVLVGTLSLLIVLPYLPYILLALVIAYVLRPFQRRLEPRFGPTISASVLIFLTTVVVLLPLIALVLVALQEGLTFADEIVAGELGVADLEARLEATGLAVDLEHLYETYQGPIGTGLRGLTDDAIRLLEGVPGVVIGVTVFLFVLFSVLKDGGRLVRWLRSVSPLRTPVEDELLERIDRLMWATVVGNVVVAGVQAILTAVGLLVLGVPGVAFLGVLTFVLALLPLIGASIVWAPVAVFLVLSGRPLAGVLLFVYGVLVVSLSDNYLRPLTVGREAHLSVGTVIVGIFGGVALFGVMGLFFGPVVLGVCQTVVELAARERRRAAS
ncbi:AI-2E family transporter [Halomontanus rarus]|uniref:AI-2E family transporter n=1 Tax=Halomontanus rarus TaxID=3034020 RepID=UPI001A99C3ED